LPSQIKPTTSKYQQASTQKRPFSVVELSPETWDKSLKKPPHFTTTLQSTSPITEQHNSKSLLPAQIKHSRSKNQQASIQKKLLSSVKFLPEPPKKLNYQTFTTVANNSSLYNNYVKQESSNSNCAKTASTGYNFNQSHQIKSLTMSQPVFTSATATFGRSLQHHNKYQALRQTPTPLIKLYNAQSPLPTQPKPTTLKYQQVSNQKTPFSAVELLPATSKEILSQPSHVFATDDQSSYHNFTHNKYYNVEYDNRYDTNQNNYFITGSDLNLNWSLNVNSLENGESGKYNRLLEYGDESYGMYSGGNNNNFHLFDDPEPQSTFAKNFETLNSYTNDIHEHVSIENKRMSYFNDLNKNPNDKTTPSVSTVEVFKFQFKNHNSLQINDNYTQSNVKNSKIFMPKSLASSASKDSKIMSPITSQANNNNSTPNHEYSISEKRFQDKKKA
jgi:hypothetical protein